jgi:CheY-like chemotaxis protein
VPGGVRFNEEKLVGDDRHLQDDWKLDTNLFYLQFSVNDTGRGLTEDERGVLFTRFSQASPRTHIHYGGSGLGLFISRRLTELQGGAIGLCSEPKKGSTFSFYIKTRHIKFAMIRKNSLPNVLPEDLRHRGETPLLKLSRPLLPLRIPSNRTENGRRSEPPSPSLLRQATSQKREATDLSPTTHSTELLSTETLHVLVVEDNLINQRVLAKQLRNLGCIVNVANHGREALDFLQRTIYWNREHPASCHIPSTESLSLVNPDRCDDPLDLHVILMDWEMPIMSGLVAVENIREMERGGQLKGRVPVIGVTANVRQQQIQTAMAAGMDDVVGKPFRVADLMVRIRSIVHGPSYGVEGRR